MSAKVKIYCAASLWWWEIVVGRRVVIRSENGFMTKAGASRNFQAAARAFNRLSR